MNEIILSRGRTTLVDEDVFDWASKRKWCATESKSGFYAYRRENKKPVYLHRLIMAAMENEMVDHIDGNTLDNRRQNLRIVTRAQNARNSNIQQGVKRPKTSRFKGVCWNKRDRCWEAQIVLDGKRLRLGKFQSENDAGRAYNAAANKEEYFRTFEIGDT